MADLVTKAASNALKMVVPCFLRVLVAESTYASDEEPQHKRSAVVEHGALSARTYCHISVALPAMNCRGYSTNTILQALRTTIKGNDGDRGLLVVRRQGSKLAHHRGPPTEKTRGDQNAPVESRL